MKSNKLLPTALIITLLIMLVTTILFILSTEVPYDQEDLLNTTITPEPDLIQELTDKLNYHPTDYDARYNYSNGMRQKAAIFNFYSIIKDSKPVSLNGSLIFFGSTFTGFDCNFTHTNEKTDCSCVDYNELALKIHGSDIKYACPFIETYTDKDYDKFFKELFLTKLNEAIEKADNLNLTKTDNNCYSLMALPTLYHKYFWANICFDDGGLVQNSNIVVERGGESHKINKTS